MNHGTKRQDEVIEQQAAEWFGRWEVGLSPEQEKEFQDWLEADKRHEARFQQCAAIWELLTGRKDASPPKRPPAIMPRPRIPRIWQLPAAAALAAAAAIAVVFYFERPEQRELAPPPIAEIQADVMKMVELADGSVMRLNANSVASIRYSDKERRVVLEKGEAHFVAAKEARPFIVVAGAVAVRTVGTAFDVRLNLVSVEVLVTEGRVRVDDTVGGGSLLAARSSLGPTETDADSAPAARLLTAGERVSIPVMKSAPGRPCRRSLSPRKSSRP